MNNSIPQFSIINQLFFKSINYRVLTVFDFGNIDQLFAFLGLLGMILSFIKSKHPVLISLISFALMISAVASRLIHVSIEALNYPAFTIPFFIFIATQILLVFLIINSKRKTNLIK